MGYWIIFSPFTKNIFALKMLETPCLTGVIMVAVAIVLRGDRGLEPSSTTATASNRGAAIVLRGGNRISFYGCR